MVRSWGFDFFLQTPMYLRYIRKANRQDHVDCYFYFHSSLSFFYVLCSLSLTFYDEIEVNLNTSIPSYLRLAFNNFVIGCEYRFPLILRFLLRVIPPCLHVTLVKHITMAILSSEMVPSQKWTAAVSTVCYRCI